MTDRMYTTTPEIEQARAIWERAVLLAERTDGYHRKMLYQFRHLYIEVAWHTHFNTVVQASVFDDTDKLAPYLKDISLHNLFN